MNALLDTHTFIWWDSDPAKLSAQVLALLHDPTITIWLSVVSVWEILIKHQMGKLELNAPLATLIAQQQANGIQILPISLVHVLEVGNLPPFHKDPFDRLLIAQANIEGLVVLSIDSVFARYSVNVMW
ncbi:MAG: type II toxin-antitoxin system VapC family toxin [Armatimonadetes bacterium]|nr:type II toxin-antitoxin system VapC family toxin [Armatimonadota bacterium]